MLHPSAEVAHPSPVSCPSAAAQEPVRVGLLASSSSRRLFLRGLPQDQPTLAIKYFGTC
ncbi:hypothetical protein ACP70R_029029 [Stipagrostis hirtigluma subsp. patula]